jgi:hypothetical protein
MCRLNKTLPKSWIHVPILYTILYMILNLKRKLNIYHISYVFLNITKPIHILIRTTRKPIFWHQADNNKNLWERLNGKNSLYLNLATEYAWNWFS